MDIFNLIFIIIMIFGFITIIISIININKYNNSRPLSNIDNSIKEMKNTIDQADLAIDDLNLMSEEIFKRFDEKQKQLLFLYDAIEKKKANSNNSNNTNNSKFDIKIDENLLNMSNQNKITKKPISNHPMAQKIKELDSKGLSVSDIAKTLDMGKGEVELIIKFGKDS